MACHDHRVERSRGGGSIAGVVVGDLEPRLAAPPRRVPLSLRIPRGVDIDADGQLRFRRRIATALVLVFPIATVAACAWTLTMKL